MCKTPGCTKKCRLKLNNHNTNKGNNDRALYSCIIDSLNQNMDETYLVSNNVVHRREKSRIAAKKRRTEEGECLTELYLSLPVAPQSRLLSCDDSQFIGNFEKTTIIKVSAYVLKLYNSLSDSRYLDSCRGFNYPVVSLFSQSMFGLFWCESSSKVVFTSPGLARLTGLYWCNIIGMPLNSIILDKNDRNNIDIPSNTVFLRFVMNCLKDKGIFTVHPRKVNQGNDNHMEDQNASVPYCGLKRDIIGKMPCSIWSSNYLGQGIHFDLIQPLSSKAISISEPVRIPGKPNPSTDPFKTNNDEIDYSNIVFSPFFAVFHIDTLETLFVDENLIKSLGIRKEDTENTTIYSFICLLSLVNMSKCLERLMTRESKIEKMVMLLNTSRRSIYRYSVVTLQICSDKDLVLPNNINSRSSANQGEAFSQNVIDAFSNMNDVSQSSNINEKDVTRAWIQAKFQLLPKKHYDNKKDILSRRLNQNFWREKDQELNAWPNNNDIVQESPELPQLILSNMQVENQSSQDNYYFASSYQHVNVCPPRYHDHFGSINMQRHHYVPPPITAETSILMRELMKPTRSM